MQSNPGQGVASRRAAPDCAALRPGYGGGSARMLALPVTALGK
jgi:hypothetical protein